MNNYYYNQQIKRYLVQFMHIFSGMEVMVGKNANRDAGLIAVPVHYSSMDKVAAEIAAGNTGNKPIRVPAMSASLQTLRRTEIQPGMNQIYSQTYLPAGGFFADDVKTLTRLRPTQYIATVNLAIWSSNLDQQFQIMEQILTVFNPDVQIQTSDAHFDWSKITTVKLSDIQYQESYPVSSQIRMPIVELTFEMPIYLSAPAEVKDQFVRDILVRISAVDQIDADTLVADFDADSIKYTTIASADDIVAAAQKLDTN